jgi:hypothetical protein
MTDTYHIKIKEFSKRLDDMIIVMDFYAKYEITARDQIPEDLLYADSMKALDRAAQRLNLGHKANLKAAPR